MTKTQIPACPECGGVLDIDARCEVEHVMMAAFQERGTPLARKTFTRPAALCTGCDFAIEIRTDL